MPLAKVQLGAQGVRQARRQAPALEYARHAGRAHRAAQEPLPLALARAQPVGAQHCAPENQPMSHTTAELFNSLMMLYAHPPAMVSALTIPFCMPKW